MLIRYYGLINHRFYKFRWKKALTLSPGLRLAMLPLWLSQLIRIPSSSASRWRISKILNHSITAILLVAQFAVYGA